MHAVLEQGSNGLIDIEDEEANNATGEDDASKTDNPADQSTRPQVGTSLQAPLHSDSSQGSCR